MMYEIEKFQQLSLNRLYSPHNRQNWIKAVVANSAVNVALISCWIDSFVWIFDDEEFSSGKNRLGKFQNRINKTILPSFRGTDNKLWLVLRFCFPVVVRGFAGEPILYELVKLSIVIRQYSSPSILVLFTIWLCGDEESGRVSDEAKFFIALRSINQIDIDRILLRIDAARDRAESSVGSEVDWKQAKNVWIESFMFNRVLS